MPDAIAQAYLIDDMPDKVFAYFFTLTAFSGANSSYDSAQACEPVVADATRGVGNAHRPRLVGYSSIDDRRDDGGIPLTGGGPVNTPDYKGRPCDTHLHNKTFSITDDTTPPRSPPGPEP